MAFKVATVCVSRFYLLILLKYQLLRQTWRHRHETFDGPCNIVMCCSNIFQIFRLQYAAFQGTTFCINFINTRPRRTAVESYACCFISLECIFIYQSAYFFIFYLFFSFIIIIFFLFNTLYVVVSYKSDEIFNIQPIYLLNDSVGTPAILEILDVELLRKVRNDRPTRYC